MNDLTVLHLSDLHIDSEGQEYSDLLKKLLNDIESQINGYHIKDNLVVIVTGDIINRGDENAIDNAKLFFQDLYKKIGDKTIRLYIVPGNHDKKRTKDNELLIASYRSFFENKVSYKEDKEGYKNNDKKKRAGYKEVSFCPTWFSAKSSSLGINSDGTLWNIQRRAYEESKYFELLDYIYGQLFTMGGDDAKALANNTFGVDVVSINGGNYAFVLLNTAWSCIDDLDNRHIIMGDFQLNSVTTELKNKVGRKTVNMVFVMGHHPFNWLYGQEQDHVFDRMIDKEQMRANVYFCGHTHDRDIINWSNINHTMYTLMSGIGWPDASAGANNNHYYSMYTFNIDINSMDIMVRSTRTGENKFRPDLSIYSGKTESNDRISRPIFYKETPGAIELSAGQDNDRKVLYASNRYLKQLSVFLKALRKIESAVHAHLDESFTELRNSIREAKHGKIDNEDRVCDVLLAYKNEIIKCIDDVDADAAEDNNMEVPKDLIEPLKQYKDEVFSLFNSYLQRICCLFYDVLSKECKGDIRFHFRYLSDKQGLQYTKTCNSFRKDSTEEAEVSVIKYKECVEKAFINENSKCSIYTINNLPIDKPWKNSSIIVPNMENYTFQKRVSPAHHKEYPWFVFGVDIANLEDNQLLYNMDYGCIDEMLGRLLGQYITLFNMDVSDYCFSYKKASEGEV